jgi:molybdenum cofactor cytidylyltransferase
VRLAALVLAAGASRRAGGVNKLLARDRSGRCMIARTVQAVLQSQATEVTVVLGHEAAAIASALDAAGLRNGRDRLRLARADDHGEGLSASLRHGIACAAERRMDGALVCLGDMPLVRPATLDRLLEQPGSDPGALAWVPVMGSMWGNPVLWRSSLFGMLLALSGDRGGRMLLDRHAPHVRTVPVCDPGIFEDFDTAERLASFAAS